MTRSLHHRLLVLLADHGVIEEPAGRVTTVLARHLDTTASRAGEVLRRAAAAGEVDLHRHAVSGRVFSARLTSLGRSRVCREGHADAPAPRPTVRVVMPVAGPMVTVRFDPELARERALGGVA